MTTLARFAVSPASRRGTFVTPDTYSFLIPDCFTFGQMCGKLQVPWQVETRAFASLDQKQRSFTNQQLVVKDLPIIGYSRATCQGALKLDGMEVFDSMMYYPLPGDETPTRQCSRCLSFLPATRDYFTPNKNGAYGLRSICKFCLRPFPQLAKEKQEKRIRKLLNIIKVLQRKNLRKQGYKLCKGCNRILPATSDYFYKSAERGDGLNVRCIDCVKQFQKNNYRRRSQDPQFAQQRKNQSQAYYHAHEIYFRENGRKQYHAHKERHLSRSRLYRISHQEHERERKRLWYQQNKDKVKANEHRRRAREKSQVAVWQDTDWQFALEYFGNCCAVCGRPRGLWHTLAADHWIPLNAPNCPGTVATNIVPLCSGVNGCNNSKRDKLPDNWLLEKYGKRKAERIMKRIRTYFETVELLKGGK